MSGKLIVVGMADLKVTTAPNALTTIGLGSCVGIALYDTKAKVAGLAHIMLPTSSLIQANLNPAKFADTATLKLLAEMSRLGANPTNIRAKIAGGAQMFNFDSTNENLRVGDRNVESIRQVLAAQRIPIIAEETGSTFGRTVEIYAEDGRFVIKAIGQEPRVL